MVHHNNGFDLVVADACPRCDKSIVLLKWVSEERVAWMGNVTREPEEHGYKLIYPSTTGRPLLPPEVPADYRDAYVETCHVLTVSPKASAALSRRLVQQFIQQELQISKKDLATEIKEVVSQKLLHPSLLSDLDHVRIVGNWAAHPNPNQQTGEIVDVEPGEAEYIVDLLERLLTTHFVDQARSAKMHAALTTKNQVHPPAAKT